MAATADVYVMRRLSDDVSIAYAIMRPYTAIPGRGSYYRRREEQPLSFDVKTIITIAFFFIFSRLEHSDKQNI